MPRTCANAGTGWTGPGRVLMDGNAPSGGCRNLEREARKRLPRDARPPANRPSEPDTSTREVMAKGGALEAGLSRDGPGAPGFEPDRQRRQGPDE